IVSASHASLTINATIDGGGGDWTANETYPIGLGWGVELNAPGVFFLDADAGNTALFEVKVATGDTLGYASIVGSAASNVSVGINAAQNLTTIDYQTLIIDDGATLYLANASIDSSGGTAGLFASFASAIYISSSGTLVVGQDQSAGNTGTVYLG